jgi:hypothetical protein
MDPKEFSIKIKDLGEFRRMYAGPVNHRSDVYQDLVFVPNSELKACADCGLLVKDRTLNYDVKFNYQGNSYWRTRCLEKDCKRIWPKLHL